MCRIRPVVRARRTALEGFRVAGPGLGGVDAEVGELVRADAAAHAHVETAAGELVEDGDLLGEPQRLVHRQHVDERADPHRRGPLGQRGEEQVR